MDLTLSGMLLQWLTYWVIYGFVETAESILTQFLWIPFYYEMKSVLLLWLVLPQTKGAAFVFQHFICPFMQKYASQIDPVFAKADQVRSCSSAVHDKCLSGMPAGHITSPALRANHEETLK